MQLRQQHNRLIMIRLIRQPVMQLRRSLIAVLLQRHIKIHVVRYIRYAIMAFWGGCSMYPLTVMHGKHTQDVHKEREHIYLSTVYSMSRRVCPARLHDR